MFRWPAGSALLNFVLDKAKHDPSITEVYLHVQVSNLDAKKFYMSHGFVDMGVIKNYYRRIEPPDGYLLSLSLGSPRETE